MVCAWNLLTWEKCLSVGILLLFFSKDPVGKHTSVWNVCQTSYTQKGYIYQNCLNHHILYHKQITYLIFLQMWSLKHKQSSGFFSHYLLQSNSFQVKNAALQIAIVTDHEYAQYHKYYKCYKYLAGKQDLNMVGTK